MVGGGRRAKFRAGQTPLQLGLGSSGCVYHMPASVQGHQCRASHSVRVSGEPWEPWSSWAASTRHLQGATWVARCCAGGLEGGDVCAICTVASRGPWRPCHILSMVACPPALALVPVVNELLAVASPVETGGVLSPSVTPVVVDTSRGRGKGKVSSVSTLFLSTLSHLLQHCKLPVPVDGFLELSPSY